jgi:hypothetical protein
LLDKKWIEQTCHDLGYTWRQRTLDPLTTIQLFTQQVLHGNIACSKVRHLSDENFSATAYCQARARLPRELFDQLLKRSSAAANQHANQHDGRWHGHRVHHLDGTTFSMPDTPELQKHFGQSGQQAPGCGFPVAHLLARFDAATGMVLDVTASPMRTHDMAKVAETQAHLQEDDFLIADCAFCTYAHVALLLQSKMHGLFPIHQRRIVNFTPRRPYTRSGRGQSEQRKGLRGLPGLPRSRWIKKLGPRDQLVEWFKPLERPQWISQEEYDALPDSIIVREVQTKVRKPNGQMVVVTMATTLRDAKKYSRKALAKLLEQRWGVEINFRHLKTTMKMEVLRCKTVDGVLKELTIYALVYNLVRLVMLDVAKRQSQDVARISFADTLAFLCYAKAGTPLPKIIINPHRPQRWDVRVLKRRPKPYKLLNKPRHEMRQAQLKQKDTA